MNSLFRLNLVFFLCRKIISEYDENYGSCGLDEAFADLTNHLQIRATSSEQQRTFPKEVKTFLTEVI
jgi:hypothetical protein